MSAPEFARKIDLRQVHGQRMELAADEAERAALARRFALVSIGSLKAALVLDAEGEVVTAKGPMRAEIVQSCAVSGDDLPVTIAEELDLRFVPERPIEATEIELEEDELDEIPYSGTAFDLGEAVAQSLALAIDPYAVGPDAERVRQEKLANQEPSGPFAALAGLKKQ